MKFKYLSILSALLLVVNTTSFSEGYGVDYDNSQSSSKYLTKSQKKIIPPKPYINRALTMQEDNSMLDTDDMFLNTDYISLDEDDKSLDESDPYYSNNMNNAGEYLYGPEEYLYGDTNEDLGSGEY